MQVRFVFQRWRLAGQSRLSHFDHFRDDAGLGQISDDDVTLVRDICRAPASLTAGYLLVAVAG